MRFSVVLVLLLVFPRGLRAELNWSSFRGPTGQGVSTEAHIPTRWSETEHVRWKTAIPGKGWSSPVSWGDFIWLTTAIEAEASDEELKKRLTNPREASQRQLASSISLRVICVRRDTGVITKDIELFNVENPNPIHLLNSYASPTPALARGRLYCHFGTFGTACIDTQTGEKIWATQLPLQHGVGPGSSPVLWKNLLLLVCDGMDAQYVAAVDTSSGDIVWRQERPPMEGTDGDFHKAFSTPLLVKWNDEEQLVIPGAQWFVSHAPSSGELLWRVNHGRGFSNVAAPVFADGIAYMITGFTKPELWAIPVSLRGEFDSSQVLWEQKRQIPKKFSPILTGGAIYLIGDNGVLSCVDINNGEIRWSKRLGGNYSASPILVGDRIVLCSHEGKSTVFRANPREFLLLSENQLDGQLMASPLPSNGSLYIRSDTHLYALQDN